MWYMSDPLNSIDATNINLKSIISKLISNSYLFKWLDEKIILNWLKNYKIELLQFKAGFKIINECDSDCRFFYLLLKWNVWVYKKNKKICEITKMSLIGELWFINPTIKRTATVLTHEDTFLMRFNQSFIDWLDLNDQVKIYKNISEEIVGRLENSNKIIVWKDDIDTTLTNDNIRKSIYTIIE